MLDKVFKPREVEGGIYKMWENGGYFTPKIDPKKKPFTILLPPPNASGKMHIGNVLMIAIEDLLVRWHRMKGEPTLWLPGTDHAGTETQITFERELKKEGKSRFDFDRNSLYRAVWDFVQGNKHLIEGQIRQMGASVDWTRYKFTLEASVVAAVQKTFQKLFREGLVYRDDYIVNYCPVCGTTYADIEVENRDRTDPFYYIKYGPFTIGTVRPETKFRDTALAVNPEDKRYRKWLGKGLDILGLLGPTHMTVIADPEVDPNFGTGIMKVTPAHDRHDYELGKKFNLPVTPIIDLSGRMDFSWFIDSWSRGAPVFDSEAQTRGAEKTPGVYTERAQKYHGKKVPEARKLVVEDLQKEALLVRVDENYSHSVKVCKAGHDIEPTILPNWFIKVEEVKKPAYEAVKKGKIKIYPPWRKITYLRWLEIMHDWAISRQNVWGIRIPVWYNLEGNSQITLSFLSKKGEKVSGKAGELLEKYSFEEIEAGLQVLRAPKEAAPTLAEKKPGPGFLQETDTFDTWFSSGQWPLVTLGYPNSKDFKYFYPTSVMETGWEIVTKWVSRMVMFGLYRTGKVPFDSVYLHGHVRALDGKKMSKSLGNVINPDEYLSQYGADVLRMGLISGTANGKDFNFPKDKIIAYRNFANKIWNVGRFILINTEGKKVPEYKKGMIGLVAPDKQVIKDLTALVKKVDANLARFRFAQAAELIYHFVWHELADKYIELSKARLQHPTPGVGRDNGGLPGPENEELTREALVALSVLRYVYLNCLKLLHPFMPFVTEEIWGKITRRNNEPLIISRWPGLR